MQNRLSEELPSVLVEKTTVVHISPSNAERLSPWVLPSSNITYLHYHNALEIGYCFHGSGVHYSGMGRYAFSAGDALIMLPEQRHLASAHAGADTKWIFTYVDIPELLGACGMDSLLKHDMFHRPIMLYDIIFRREHPGLADSILRFIEAYRTFDPCRLEMLAVLFSEIFLKVSQINGGLPAYRLFAPQESSRLDAALAQIQREIEGGQIPQLEDLAAASFMSISNFRKVFREMTGVSPHSYIMEQVIRRAQQLLRDDTQSVLSISTELGFQSISTFNRNFKAICGMAPEVYRRTHANLF